MIYENEKTKNISFPLGGIGTGCIGLAGNGELKEWEIFNRPNKVRRNGYSHFAIKASCNGKNTLKVLQGDTCDNLMGTYYGETHHGGIGYGPSTHSMAGFPHFERVTFDGSFPLARLTFSDADFPAVIRLTAFNPFTVHDEFNASLPAAFFEWEIENISDSEVEFTVACTVQNHAECSRNQVCSEGGMQGIFLESADKGLDEIDYSDLCVLTDHPDTRAQACWYRGKWMDACTTYWKNLLNQDRLSPRSYPESGTKDHGTVASYVKILPKETSRVRFIIAWNVPNAYNYWSELDPIPTWKNYYATQFENSFATAKYALSHFDELLEKTKIFTDALASCTLSDAVKDAISANLSVLKSPTVLRLEDGSFWGWEGCSATMGSCMGTCQHVWNYAYALPFLFPRLERSIRETTLQYALQDNGATSFRVNLPREKKMSTKRACVDGQMGEIIKCYREWKISGDDAWIEANAQNIFKMLEYAWSDQNPDRWDADCDGILEGRQHHTLDMELFGPSSWLEGFYLLALDCATKIAEHVGDTARVELYQRLYQNGKAFLNEELFNGKYFYQKVDLHDKALVDSFEATTQYWNDEAEEIKYQVANGCIIDQMLADWHAALIGMPSVFDPEKKKTALQYLYQNNFKSSMRGITNMWRNFSLGDEAGTLICTYPDDTQTPTIPIPYCEETMTGFEYALAGLMIAEGMTDKGERLVAAIRDRYDGEKRNPFNEIECGSNYARSMASFALMPIYSGFSFDLCEGRIGFAPICGEGRYLFSVGECFGTVEITKESCKLTILGGTLPLKALSLPFVEKITHVTLDGTAVDFTCEEQSVVFDSLTVTKELFLQ